MKTKLRIINPNAGDIDIGAEKIFVCASDAGYQSFDTFTEDLKLAAEYLKKLHNLFLIASILVLEALQEK